MSITEPGIKSKGFHIGLFSITIILGVLLTVQLKTQQNLRTSLPTHRASDIALMLKEQEKAIMALESELKRVTDERRSSNTKLQKARLRSLLGMTQVEGPGLKVTLIPGDGSYIDPLWVDTIVNELWAAGAEAVSINGERVITTTGIGLAHSGNKVMVNGEKLSAPFTILAIGDPMTLDSALMMRNSAVDLLKYYKLNVRLSEERRLMIPATARPLQYTYVASPGLQERR